MSDFPSITSILCELEEHFCGSDEIIDREIIYNLEKFDPSQLMEVPSRLCMDDTAVKFSRELAPEVWIGDIHVNSQVVSVYVKGREDLVQKYRRE